MTASRGAARALAVCVATATLASCALLERGHLRRTCSQWSPGLQTSLLAARVRLGGPDDVYVAGWACGQLPEGPLVRIAFLHYRGIPREVERAVVPVIFEDGRLVGDGWELLRRQPDRYGTAVDVRDWGPPAWRLPPGWVAHRGAGTR